MISVEEASRLIQSTVQQFSSETIAIDQVGGKVLRETIYADRDFPPYDRVTMDGIAICRASFVEGARQFPIQSTQQAGMPQQTLNHPDHCIEVMTGAVLPVGTDAVIRYEDLDISDGMAQINLSEIGIGQNVHDQGEDRKQGTPLLTAGVRLSAPEVAVAATAGYTQLAVSRLPKVVIISTGDELVEVAAKPLPHQIRKSNSYMIQAALAEIGISSDRLHILDDRETLRARLTQILEDYEVLILSGGVSKGKADFIPDTLAELGVKKSFHRVAQRPGKPFWFGIAPNDRFVFALPGNPVSTFVNFYRYVRPWLFKSLGLSSPHLFYAQLSEDFQFKPDLTYFLQVKTHMDDKGILWAQPIAGHGSGDHANLLFNDAFLELPRGKDLFKKGETYPLIWYRPVS